MSVGITFEPGANEGLIAVGTSLADAARRMGVPLATDCHGRGECTSCLISVERGAALLSEPTEAELKIVGAERIAGHQRLACQARTVAEGEVVVRQNADQDCEARPSSAAEMRKTFSQLKLDRKISTLLQLEALTMIEALDAIVEKPLALGEKFLNRVLGTGGPTKADGQKSPTKAQPDKGAKPS